MLSSNWKFYCFRIRSYLCKIFKKYLNLKLLFNNVTLQWKIMLKNFISFLKSSLKIKDFHNECDKCIEIVYSCVRVKKEHLFLEINRVNNKRYIFYELLKNCKLSTVLEKIFHNNVTLFRACVYVERKKWHNLKK